MKDFAIKFNRYSIDATKKLSIKKEIVFFVICLAIMILGACFAFPLSYVTKSNLFIGLALLPLVLHTNREQSWNSGYFLAILFFGFMAFHYSIRISYFFALAFLILFMTELLIGKVNKLILFLLIFMSPFFQLLAVIIGFPIRLQLSAWAGQILSITGLNIGVEGNMITLNGANFNVDQACMGLSMFDFSMLIGVFVLGYQFRVHHVKLSFTKVSLFFIAVFGLAVLCNLLRIILLVIFKIPAENPMHEIVGLLCFGVYVVLPISLIGTWMVYKYAKPVVANARHLEFTKSFKLIILTLTASMFFIGVHIHIKKDNKETEVSYAMITIPGFQTKKVNDGIISLYNGSSLVYVKPIQEFFSAEHTPLICWVGSGFHFEGVRKITINAQEIYIGQLAKPGQRLFTAWWYGNGSTQTINQLEWRLRMLKGEAKFSLINVTAKNEKALMKNIQTLMNNKNLTQNANHQ